MRLAECVPVPLDPICEYVVVQVTRVHPLEVPRGALGRYLPGSRIEIVMGLPEEVFRLTLAHEIGHHVLYHDARSRWDSMDSLFARGDPHEREAWDFAGELLMPTSAFRREVNRSPDPDILAVRFKVTRQAVIVELSKRNLL
ncbi:MAG: ImmA/IrrE family metallo-endopeptidase [Bacillota bacterium]